MHENLPYLLQSSGLFLQVVAATRLLVAAVLGGLLGLERSIAGKHAGMRTYILVSLGSALFVVVGTLASFQLSGFPSLNPLQIAASIVIGIGFIGSGLAVFRGEQPIELTTASGIWVAAGIGMACGYGFFIVGFVAMLLAILTLSLLIPVENSIRSRFRRENP